jgi:hypothetical protein
MQIMIFPTEKVGHILGCALSAREQKAKGTPSGAGKGPLLFISEHRRLETSTHTHTSPCFVCAAVRRGSIQTIITHRCWQPSDQSGREGPQVSRTLPHQRVSRARPWSAIVAARQIICADWFEALALCAVHGLLFGKCERVNWTSQRARRHENLIAFSTHVANAAKITSRAVRKLTVIYYQSVADWNALCIRKWQAARNVNLTAEVESHWKN